MRSPVIPYLELPKLPFGLAPFGVLFTLSVIVGHLVFVRRARGLATPLGTPAEIEALAIGVALAAFAGAYGVGLVVASGGALSSAGGLLGALLGLAAITRFFRLSLIRAADAAAYAFPFAWMVARAGCALAHDHLGKRSTSLFAVRFPEGPRLDLGLLEWLATPLLALLVVLVARRARRASGDGVVAGALAVAYGVLRFGLDFLRFDDRPLRADPRVIGFTAAQWVCLIVLLPLGTFALVRARPEVTTPRSP